MCIGQKDTVCSMRNALSPIPSRTTDKAVLVPLYSLRLLSASVLEFILRKPLSKPGIAKRESAIVAQEHVNAARSIALDP